LHLLAHWLGRLPNLPDAFVVTSEIYRQVRSFTCTMKLHGDLAFCALQVRSLWSSSCQRTICRPCRVYLLQRNCFQVCFRHIEVLYVRQTTHLICLPIHYTQTASSATNKRAQTPRPSYPSALLNGIVESWCPGYQHSNAA